MLLPRGDVLLPGGNISRPQSQMLLPGGKMVLPPGKICFPSFASGMQNLEIVAKRKHIPMCLPVLLDLLRFPEVSNPTEQENLNFEVK